VETNYAPCVKIKREYQSADCSVREGQQKNSSAGYLIGSETQEKRCGLEKYVCRPEMES
jgi:hypothetical protein